MQIMNQFPAVAMNEGVRDRKKLWSEFLAFMPDSTKRED
jgi:hypothetical protein